MDLTRFERARMLGARALQISMGAPPLAVVDSVDAIRIALAEFEDGLLPMTPVRLAHVRD